MIFTFNIVSLIILLLFVIAALLGVIAYQITLYVRKGFNYKH